MANYTQEDATRYLDETWTHVREGQLVLVNLRLDDMAVLGYPCPQEKEIVEIRLLALVQGMSIQTDMAQGADGLEGRHPRAALSFSQEAKKSIDYLIQNSALLPSMEEVQRLKAYQDKIGKIEAAAYENGIPYFLRRARENAVKKNSEQAKIDLQQAVLCAKEIKKDISTEIASVRQLFKQNGVRPSLWERIIGYFNGAR